jgi:hypothetical protein
MDLIPPDRRLTFKALADLQKRLKMNSFIGWLFLLILMKRDIRLGLGQDVCCHGSVVLHICSFPD